MRDRGPQPRPRVRVGARGGPDLLRLATAVRSAPNALIDISYTITRFQGTSVHLDLAHLLTTFDHRLVYGSDFPEAELAATVRLVEGRAEAANPSALRRSWVGTSTERWRWKRADDGTDRQSGIRGALRTAPARARQFAADARRGQPGREHVRFEVMADVVQDVGAESVLDVGCGFADLHDHLRERGCRATTVASTSCRGCSTRRGAGTRRSSSRRPTSRLRASRRTLVDVVVASGVFNARPDAATTETHITRASSGCSSSADRRSASTS